MDLMHLLLIMTSIIFKLEPILRKENLGDLSHPLNIIDDKKFNDENKILNNRNINFLQESVDKIILSNLFFHKNRFCKHIRENNKEIFFFRKRNEDDISHSITISNFFTELMTNFNDKIYQVDKHLNSDKNDFSSIITYKIKIIEVDNDKLVIERKYYL